MQEAKTRRIMQIFGISSKEILGYVNVRDIVAFALVYNKLRAN